MRIHSRNFLATFLVLLFTGFGVAEAQVASEQVAVPPPLLLANVWRSELAVSDYLVSEKFDGVRAYWDGKVLRFRSGRTVSAPLSFLAALPAVAVDGELWLGRQRFDELSAIVRRSDPVAEEWARVRYLVFDSPGTAGSFSQRLDTLRRHLPEMSDTTCRPTCLILQEHVPSLAALQARLDTVVGSGGEGLMLHRADAEYRAGRNDDLLKLKPWNDAEARVVGYVAGKGRLHGQTGALVVESRATGKTLRFRIGSGLSDLMRTSPPPIGSVVTYRFVSLTPSGRPRFPVFWRLRDEL